MVQPKFSLLKNLIDIEIQKSKNKEKNDDDDDQKLLDAIKTSRTNNRRQDILEGKEGAKNERQKISKKDKLKQLLRAYVAIKPCDYSNGMAIEIDAPTSEKKKRDYSIGKRIRRKKFTPAEDKIVLESMKKFGDDAAHNDGKLGKILGRHDSSIRSRRLVLKRGKQHRKVSFTFEEDKFILDFVISKMKLSKSSLTSIDMTSKETESLNNQLLNRSLTTIHNRWRNHLKPWLLQYYHGTLNCDIKTMLANFINENHNDFESIDWNSVSQKREFAGHTELTLRGIYSKLLCRTKKILLHYQQDLSPQNVAEVTNSYPILKRKRSAVLLRKQNIINYFEENVGKEMTGQFSDAM